MSLKPFDIVDIDIIEKHLRINIDPVRIRGGLLVSYKIKIACQRRHNLGFFLVSQLLDITIIDTVASGWRHCVFCTTDLIPQD
jgi:hypothetical protein